MCDDPPKVFRGTVVECLVQSPVQTPFVKSQVIRIPTRVSTKLFYNAVLRLMLFLCYIKQPMAQKQTKVFCLVSRKKKRVVEIVSWLSFRSGV